LTVPSLSIFVPADGSTTHIGLIVGLSVFVGIVLLVVGLGAIYVAKKRMDPAVPEGVLVASVNPEYWSASTMYIADEWEVPREKVEIKHELGKGSFGMVYKGIAYDIIEGVPEVHVAVKVCSKATP
jgi:hypothetical protein